MSDLSLLGTSGSHMMHCAGVAKVQQNFTSTLYIIQFTEARPNLGHLFDRMLRYSLFFLYIDLI